MISAAIGLFGAAAVLANWERPSSFSPFVRYPTEDVAMLVAGAAWAAFSVLVFLWEDTTGYGRSFRLDCFRGDRRGGRCRSAHPRGRSS